MSRAEPSKPSEPSIAEARADAQRAAAERKVARRGELDERFGPVRFGFGAPGGWLLVGGSLATALFTLTTVVGVVVVTDASHLVVIAVDLGLFALGSSAFVAALWIGAQRSRDDDIDMAGWWWLSGSAPPAVSRGLRLLLVAQIVVGVTGAAIRPFTALAFGVLVPILGSGVIGMWGARYGYFPPRRRPAGHSSAP